MQPQEGPSGDVRGGKCIVLASPETQSLHAGRKSHGREPQGISLSQVGGVRARTREQGLSVGSGWNTCEQTGGFTVVFE